MNQSVTARYFRLVFDNTTYHSEIGYLSDLQFGVVSVDGQPLEVSPVPTNTLSHRLPVVGASASDESDDAKAEFVLDNFPGTAWKANKAGLKSAYIQLDLGQTRKVTSLRYFNSYVGYAKHTYVEYSVDGTNWTAFPGGVDINTGGYGPSSNYGINTIGSFNALEARYVRFRIENPEGYGTLGGYGEVDVLGY